LAASGRSAAGADTTLATAALAGATTRALASAAAWPTRRIVSSKIVLAEASGLAAGFRAAALAGALFAVGALAAGVSAAGVFAAGALAPRVFAAAAVLAAGAITATAATVAFLASAAISFTLPTTGSTAFTALLGRATLGAFAVLAVFAGLAIARRAAVTGLRAALLVRAASAFWALAVLFLRISTVVVFLSMFLRAAALLFEVSARAVVLALFGAFLPVVLRVSFVRALAERAAAAFRRVGAPAEGLAVRFAPARADAPGLRDLDLALARAPAFGFFGLFLTDAIRTYSCLVPHKEAEHATNDAIRSIALTTVSRSAITRRPAPRPGSIRKPQGEKPADSESRVEKGSGSGAPWQSTGEAVRSES
jgi:hypothetical protein